MIRTFNCGVGFCLIVEKKIFRRLKKYLQKKICHMKLVLFLMKKKNKVIKIFKW